MSANFAPCSTTNPDKIKQHTLLSARLLDLRRNPYSNQPIMGLELLHCLNRIIDQCEARALATTVLCPETEDGDLVFAGFVEFGELAAEFVFRDIGAVGVKDIAVRHGLER